MTAIHSYRSGRGWAVSRAGAARAIRAGLTESGAWALARKLAAGGVAYRHGDDGRIIERRA